MRREDVLNNSTWDKFFTEEVKWGFYLSSKNIIYFYITIFNIIIGDMLV